jgi:hypothetical protein
VETLANTGCLRTQRRSFPAESAQGGRNRRDYCRKIKRCRRSTGADSRERSIGDRLLAADEFEALANQFFAHPMASVRGWERALDAQARIVREVERVLARNRAGDVLLVGRGAVGNFVTMPVLPSIEFMTRPPGAVSASCSQKTGVACCIHGVEWKTWLWYRIVFDGGTLIASQLS